MRTTEPVIKTVRIILEFVCAAAFLSSCAGPPAAVPESLRVSADQRFLTDQDGNPFFYLGDTAWELFHRLTYEEAAEYLEDRASKGFNVVQAVAISELDGLTVPDACGFLPFVDLDPTRPAVVPGADNDYWDKVDRIVKKAGELGIYIGLLPTWGRYWHDTPVCVFNTDNAYVYG